MKKLDVKDAILLAVQAHKTGDLAKADCYYTAILKAIPSHPAANHNMGVLAVDLGRREEAIPFFQRAIEAKVPIEQYWLSYMNALGQLGKTKETDELLIKAKARGFSDKFVKKLKERLLKAQSEDSELAPKASIDELLTLYNQEKYSLVVIQSYLLTSKYVKDVVLWNLYGAAAAQIDNLDDAIFAFERVISLKPDFADAYNNLGLALQNKCKLKDALKNYKIALSLKPGYAAAHYNTGNALYYAGNLAGAMEAYREAVRCQPDYADAYDNLGRLHWLRRDFVEAFELMEWRWRKKQGSIGIKLKSDKPTWDGNDKKKVFVWKEQGIGDEIMFGSMLSDARRKSRKLIVECDKRLLPLYKRSFPKGINFVENRKIVNERDYDTQIAIGSLPLAFRRELRDFAGVSSGWLRADYRKVKGIRKKLDAKPNDKIIGITWFTNASDPRAKRRNIPVDIFAKYLAQIPANFVNLQYGETAVHLSKMRSKFDLEVAEIDGIDLFNDLDGLAALISACDIVISIDNATVHLAGALGVDTRVLLPFAPDYRWGIKQADSYWYDSLTLYRQETRGDWQKPLEKLKEDLAKYLSQSSMS
ncbi:tetratricopeptide repeat protein [Paracoccaceae bacterium]|nr:tetratricopeptide repeat protein [Paracoccaceae bacterium]